MPREEKMFSDVVDPSVKVGNQQWYTVPLSVLVHTAGYRRHRHHSAPGRRHSADATVDAGVRGGAAAATSTATSAAATGRSEATGGATDQSERRAHRGAVGDQAGSEDRHQLRPQRRASRVVSPAVSSAASSAACPIRLRHLRHRRQPAPVRVGGNIKQPTKTKDVRPGLPAHRAVRSRAGRGDHRSRDRAERPRARTRACSGRFRCSIPRRSTPCGSGSSRRPCSTACPCPSS